jgi:hypothetical protein
LSGKSLTALGLHIAQDRAAFEPVESFTEHQLHAMSLVDTVEPGAGFFIKPAAPHVAAAMNHRNMGLRASAKQSRNFRGDPATSNDDDVLFKIEHLAQREDVALGAEVKNISEIVSGDLRTTRAAACGEARFFELDGLSIRKDGVFSLEVELRNDGIQPQIHMMLRKPRRIMNQRFLRGGAERPRMEGKRRGR